MATKKTSKPVEKKAPSAPKKKEEVAGPPVALVHDPALDAQTYLMSIGTRPQRLAPMVAWAKGKGLSVATFS